MPLSCSTPDCSFLIVFALRPLSLQTWPRCAAFFCPRCTWWAPLWSLLSGMSALGLLLWQALDQQWELVGSICSTVRHCPGYGWIMIPHRAGGHVGPSKLQPHGSGPPVPSFCPIKMPSQPMDVFAIQALPPRASASSSPSSPDSTLPS